MIDLYYLPEHNLYITFNETEIPQHYQMNLYNHKGEKLAETPIDPSENGTYVYYVIMDNISKVRPSLALEDGYELETIGACNEFWIDAEIKTHNEAVNEFLESDEIIYPDEER